MGHRGAHFGSFQYVVVVVVVVVVQDHYSTIPQRDERDRTWEDLLYRMVAEQSVGEDVMAIDPEGPTTTTPTYYSSTRSHTFVSNVIVALHLTALSGLHCISVDAITCLNEQPQC